jgi:parvulin-like peptidyl-prolyl isomerase
MRVIRAALSPLAILLAAGFGLAGLPARTDQIVLKVGNETFTDDDFSLYVRATAGESKLSDVSLSRLFDKFIEENLFLGAARRQGLALTPEEKQAYLSKLAGESLAGETGSTAGESRNEHLFDRPLIEKYTYQFLKDVKVEESEIKSYYEEHKKDYLLPERIKVSQILLETEARAVAVLRRLQDTSEETFRKIAQEESAGPEAFKGGEMGIFKSGELPFEMEKVVFALEESRLSPVFESSYGFHIFRVDRKYPPQLLSELEAAPSIRIRILDRKIQEALSAHLAGLKTSMDWGSAPEKLSFAYQRNVP